MKFPLSNTVIALTLFLVVADGWAQTPASLRPDIVVERVLGLPNNTVRIAEDPTDGTVYIIETNGTIYSLNLARASRQRIYGPADHGVDTVTGFAISCDGTFFIVGIATGGQNNLGIIRKGVPDGESRAWSTLAQTVPYAQSNVRDHRFNAIEVTPDCQYVIVNSGSRTDHGEIGTGGREFPITSAYFKLPVEGENITLENDESALAPYLFADGLRNSYDMAFSPEGELFSVENCGARDDPEEMNWIREGHHYGFPWRLSTHDNPQRFPDFDPPDSDPLIVDGINMEGTFYNDPGFPAPPEGVVFTDPILNIGPDADHFRDSDGLIKDASEEGRAIGTFTPHSSPLGLVFDQDGTLTDEFSGDAFVISYNDAGLRKYAPFLDPGEDLLHVHLIRIVEEDRYLATVTRLVQGFTQPVDALMIDNKIYVIEYGNNGGLWRVTLPSNTTEVGDYL